MTDQRIKAKGFTIPTHIYEAIKLIIAAPVWTLSVKSSLLKSGANPTNNTPDKNINGKNYQSSGVINSLNEKAIANINTIVNINLCFKE